LEELETLTSDHNGAMGFTFTSKSAVFDELREERIEGCSLVNKTLEISVFQFKLPTRKPPNKNNKTMLFFIRFIDA
jgi:hypothetical protein